MLCGLDFGTSNTTLGIPTADGPKLVTLEGDSVTLPSAVFFDFEAHAFLVGQAAVQAYVTGVRGRFMRSLKSVLGTELIEETTQIGRERIGFREVIGRFLSVAKRRAEAAAGQEITRVLHGRPVHFVTDDAEADRRAETALREIAESIGFKEIAFQYEPVAAAFDYELRLDREEVALVADIGGGTSDFSVVRLGPERIGRADRRDDVLANDGVRVGGTNFDTELLLADVMPLFGFRSAMKKSGLDVPSSYYFDLATWSKTNFLYQPQVVPSLRQIRRDAVQPDLVERLIRVVQQRAGHTLLMGVEEAKITLSDVPETRIDLSWLEPHLGVAIDRTGLDTAISGLTEKITASIRRCLGTAGLRATDIDAIILTGGSTLLRHVRTSILAETPEARIVESDRFGAVGVGLTIEAQRLHA